MAAPAYALRSGDIAHPDEGVDRSLLSPRAGRIEDIASKHFDDDDARKIDVEEKAQPELDALIEPFQTLDGDTHRLPPSPPLGGADSDELELTPIVTRGLDPRVHLSFGRRCIAGSSLAMTTESMRTESALLPCNRASVIRATSRWPAEFAPSAAVRLSTSAAAPQFPANSQRAPRLRNRACRTARPAAGSGPCAARTKGSHARRRALPASTGPAWRRLSSRSKSEASRAGSRAGGSKADRMFCG